MGKPTVVENPWVLSEKPSVTAIKLNIVSWEPNIDLLKIAIPDEEEEEEEEEEKEEEEDEDGAKEDIELKYWLFMLKNRHNSWNTDNNPFRRN